MSAAAAADLEREIRAICDRHGVTRQQLRGICEQLLREEPVEPVEPADSEPPSGGTQFEAVRLFPEGWVVLSPWVTTVDGYWYRHHVVQAGTGSHSRERQEFCEHLARQLNAPERPTGGVIMPEEVADEHC